MSFLHVKDYIQSSSVLRLSLPSLPFVARRLRTLRLNISHLEKRISNVEYIKQFCCNFFLAFMQGNVTSRQGLMDGMRWWRGQRGSRQMMKAHVDCFTGILFHWVLGNCFSIVLNETKEGKELLRSRKKGRLILILEITLEKLFPVKTYTSNFIKCFVV